MRVHGDTPSCGAGRTQWLQPTVRRFESVSQLQFSESSSVWLESPAWTREVVGSNPTSQTNSFSTCAKPCVKNTDDR